MFSQLLRDPEYTLTSVQAPVYNWVAPFIVRDPSPPPIQITLSLQTQYQIMTCSSPWLYIGYYTMTFRSSYRELTCPITVIETEISEIKHIQSPWLRQSPGENHQNHHVVIDGLQCDIIGMLIDIRFTAELSFFQ